jgi:hypothetical protein
MGVDYCDLFTELRAHFQKSGVTCRNRVTIWSGLCFFPRAIPGSSHTSLSHIHWYKIRPALHLTRAASRGLELFSIECVAAMLLKAVVLNSSRML